MKIALASVVALLVVALPGAAKGAPTQNLIVSKVGSGSGTVSSSPARINCGSVCSASFKRNSTVTLTAIPASGSTLAGWSGDCSGSSCTLRMSVDRSVTAIFNVVSLPPPGGHMNWFRNCLGNCPGSVSPTYAASFDFISTGEDWYSDPWRAAGAKTIDYTEIGTCYDSWPGPQPFVADCLNNGWELHNADGSIGQTINPNCGPSCTVVEVDPGNVGYQQFELAKIRDIMQHGNNGTYGGYDGLYFDNFSSGVCATTVGSHGDLNYPVYDHNGNLLYSNDRDLQDAELSFTQNVIVPLMNEGYYVGANSRGGDCPPPGGNGTGFTGPADKAWVSQYAQYFSNPHGFNFFEEYLGWDGPGTHFPSGVGCDDSDAGIMLSGDSAWCLKWDEYIDAMAYSDSLSDFNRYVISYYGNYARQCRYTVASRFLTWNGSTGGITATSNPVGSLPACEQLQLGAPLNDRYKVGPSLTCPTNFPCSAWRRDFVDGYVIVNPTQQSVTIGLDTIASGDAVLHHN